MRNCSRCSWAFRTFLDRSLNTRPSIYGWAMYFGDCTAIGPATAGIDTRKNVCVGCGSLFLSHLNDAGFWIVKDLLGLTVAQTFRTWTVTETLIGVSGLFVCWGLDMIF